MQLDNHNTKVVKGNLFEICELAEKERKENIPHVLILDEINRVDLSRLLGEVFSALENRNEEIELGVGSLKLAIPSNLYVIGTMNEIDFSLERVDFALRRRFLWFFYGYNEEILMNMIRIKDKEFETALCEEEIEHFINNSTALNSEVVRSPELGKQFEIGHTFFSEVVNIFKEYKTIKGYTNRMQSQLFRPDGPVKILWDISIEPIISAFLGNIEFETKKSKLDDFKKVFLKWQK